jgi:hypothetical protein
MKEGEFMLSCSQWDCYPREVAMRKIRIMISVALVTTIFSMTIPGFSIKKAVAMGELTFDYFISYKGGEFSAPQVTIWINNLNTEKIDLVISPMTMNGDEDQSLWLLDTQRITATSKDGLPVPATDGGIISIPYMGQVAQYRLLEVNTTDQSTITIHYVLDQPIMVGYLETFLLRPRDHNLVGNATLRFELPTNWRAVTVLTEEQNGLFSLGPMDGFYSDNVDPIYNFVPAAFAVGEQDEIVEVPTTCGRLIYAYHAGSSSPIPADSARALLGKAIFEYYCSVIGPLAPYNAYISGMDNDWLNYGDQPGLYSFDVQHNRTMDLLQSQPSIEYHPWEFNLCSFTTCPANKKDYSGYGFAHKLLRAWLSSGKGGLLYFSNEPDWFLRGGMSHYFQEMVMSYAFGQHKVYERFQDLYNYYQTNYVQTGLDLPIECPNSNEMNCSFLTNFKSGLWAFYLNQRILEATQGEKNLSDLSRYLYATYAGTGKPVTITKIQDAVNLVAGIDLSEVWTRYAYGDEPLPLDTYFQDDDQDGLMNGLELERHTDPQLADTDGNGIDDGVEYAMDCEQKALDPYYCVGIIPPGVKGFELIPSILAMNSHPHGSSDMGGYYGEIEYSIDLGDAAITLDGLSSDWPDISPLASDPQESTLYDFKALYGFTDTKNLYLRIDPYGTFPSNGLGQFEFYIDIQTDDGKSSFQVWSDLIKPEEVHLGHVVDNGEWDSQKTFMGAALDMVIELIIPLEFLGFPQSATISADARVIEGTTKNVYDSFNPVVLTIEATLMGTTKAPVMTITSPVPTVIPTIHPINTPVDTPADTPVKPSFSNSDWHTYWNSYWWLGLVLLGAGIIIGAVSLTRKKKP